MPKDTENQAPRADKLPVLHEPTTVASLLKVTVGTLRQWRHKKIGPAFMRVGKTILYPDDKLREWIAKQMVNDRQGCAA